MRRRGFVYVGFSAYQFLGLLNERYDMVIDSVMPLMARAIGLAVTDYSAAISHLAEPPRSLGYREVLSLHGRRQQVEEALRIVQERSKQQPWPKDTQQLALW